MLEIGGHVSNNLLLYSWLLNHQEINYATSNPQQGDSLGPLPLCLAIHHHYTQLSAEFCVTYLDNITTGGMLEAILHNLNVIRSATEIGLIVFNPLWPKSIQLKKDKCLYKVLTPSIISYI